MIKELIEPKRKAENFLYRVIDQSWDSIVKDKNGKLVPPEQLVEAIDWTLRLEAYAYLGRRKKDLIPRYASEIRSLWNNWIEQVRTNEEQGKRIFWPASQCGYVPQSPMKRERMGMDGVLLWLEPPTCDIESHVAIFRAKESLGIGGYEHYLNNAKDMLVELLLHDDIFANLLNSRIIWEIMRSPMLRRELKDWIKLVIPKLRNEISKREDEIKRDVETVKEKGIEDEEIIRQVRYGCFDDYFWASVGFFSSLCGLGNEMNELAKKASIDLIDHQYRETGSFEDNVITTCLAASSIYLTKVDPSGSACLRAIGWLIKKQNEDGSWDLSLAGDTPTISQNTLSTVVVLETLDLITNDKPLPLWASEKKPDIHREVTYTRTQAIKPFPTPSGANWVDVSIRFLSREAAELKVGSVREGRSFAEMGFMDNRSQKPDILWWALMHFGFCSGEISWDTPNLHPRVLQNLKSYVKDLRKRLRHLFGIKEDPFESYKKVKAYQTKFVIKVSESAKDDFDFFDEFSPSIVNEDEI